MKKMMLEHYQQVLRYVSNFAAVVVAIHAYRLQQQPDFASTFQFSVVFLQYLAACWVARWNVTFHTLRLLNLLSHIGHVSYVINMHVSAEEADYNFHSVYSAALRVFVAAVIHDTPVIIPCQTFVCVVEVACHFCLEGAAPRGPPWHFLGAQAAILLLVCGVAIMVQERARTSIRASLQSADANLSLEGFQRVLRSVCDADVLLDDGVKFTDLLDQDGKTEFETFVRKSCSASQSPHKKEEKDNSCSIPPCLRVSLPSAYSRVGVDIFHVPVPRFVDAAGPLHLLAFTEDPDTRIQPDATLGAIPEALSVYSEADDVQDRMSTAADSEGGCSKHSLGSSILCRVHPVPELRELTMLVDASTDQQDVLQVHAKFKRDKRVAKFAQDQCQVGSPERDEMPPLMLRRLDDQNKFLAANTVNLAPGSCWIQFYIVVMKKP
ncbi:unnamed protein product [Symbiodinium necroappetens]|uniref:Uncharacterized protein n=1 Tax=Symbiodinium necroappetens TaxID=1628268 RepID=A0A812YCU4_9DINO|nr:unnamed protein product [Symbiodinium necroappetens]